MSLIIFRRNLLRFKCILMFHNAVCLCLHFWCILKINFKFELISIKLFERLIWNSFKDNLLPVWPEPTCSLVSLRPPQLPCKMLKQQFYSQLMTPSLRKPDKVFAQRNPKSKNWDNLSVTLKYPSQSSVKKKNRLRPDCLSHSRTKK